MEHKSNTSTFIPYEQSYLFSSDVANGALNVTEAGSRFSVQLDRPIAIAKRAANVTAEMSQASVWYTSPNVSASKGNNVFYFIVAATPELFIIPDGLYSISALNQLISREFVKLGYAADQILISADDATQTIVLTYPYVDTQVDFTPTNSPFTLLGFDNRLSPLAPSTAGQPDSGDRVAAFNTLNSYLVHTSLIMEGIPVNNQGASIIGRIPIDAKVGRQINYAPDNPTKVAANELIGKSVNYFDLWITSQDNEPLDMFFENWSVLIVLKYWAEV